MAVLSGLERATGGSIRIAGADFTALDEDGLARARRGRIGIVLQAFHLLPTMTALENVAVPLELAGDATTPSTSPAPSSRRSASATGSPIIRPSFRAASSSASRSPGPPRPRPALIFADEPTGNLDAATGQAILDLLFERQRETGATLLVITHDPALAARCGRVLEMQDGRIVTDSKA